MAASTEVLIGNPGADHVLIRPLVRTHPGLFDRWDGNWLDCELHVAAGGFRGDLRAQLRSEEFAAFAQELDALSQTLEGTASFSTMEGQMSLALAGHLTGRVQVTGEAVDDLGAGNRLRFAFEIESDVSTANLPRAGPAPGGVPGRRRTRRLMRARLEATASRPSGSTESSSRNGTPDLADEVELIRRLTGRGRSR